MRRSLIFAAALTATLSVPAFGRDRYPQMHRWVRQLGHRSYAVRIKAREMLERQGQACVPLVEAATHSKDLEVRRQARAILAMVRGTSWRAIRRRGAGASKGSVGAVEVVHNPTLAWFKGQLRAQPIRGGRWQDQERWASPGITSLVLLTFLGAGHTHRFGRYRELSRRALRWLIREQRKDGQIGRCQAGDPMFSHVLGTLALVESYRMTRSPLIKQRAVRALAYLVRTQDPRGGDWRQTQRGGTPDIDVTPFALLALQSGRLCAPGTPGVAAAFQRLTRGIGQRVPEKTDPSALGTAILARVFGGARRDDPALLRRARQLARVDLKRASPLSIHIATLAMSRIGGTHWDRWKPRIAPPRPAPGRLPAASSAPTARAGHAAGRVYTTALRMLTSQVYHRRSR